MFIGGGQGLPHRLLGPPSGWLFSSVIDSSLNPRADCTVRSRSWPRPLGRRNRPPPQRLLSPSGDLGPQVDPVGELLARTFPGLLQQATQTVMLRISQAKR